MLMYMNFVNDNDELIRQELVLKGIDPDSQPDPLGR